MKKKNKNVNNTVIDFDKTDLERLQACPVVSSSNPLQLLEAAVPYCTVDGMILEFGVYSGNITRMLDKLFDSTIYGFDSWEGLPKDSDDVRETTGFREGDFKCRIPNIDSPKVELYQGWFEEVLPEFLEEYDEDARLVVIDSDQYISAKHIFDNLEDRIVPGTVIYMDEYKHHPNWEDREYRAFKEFIERTKLRYEYIAKTRNEERVILRIL
jgi:hypothetical protein